jgi:hypothetical protein
MILHAAHVRLYQTEGISAASVVPVLTLHWLEGLALRTRQDSAPWRVLGELSFTIIEVGLRGPSPDL